MDERLICIAGKIRIGSEDVEMNIALKFDESAISEKIYEAIKGKDLEHGLLFRGTIHDGCLTEEK